MSEKKTSQVYVSKKKINGIKDFLVEKKVDNIDQVMKQICSILNFDPDLKISDPKKTQRVLEWRKKVKEETGFSPYVLNNKKIALNALNASNTIKALKEANAAISASTSTPS